MFKRYFFAATTIPDDLTDSTTERTEFTSVKTEFPNEETTTIPDDLIDSTTERTEFTSVKTGSPNEEMPTTTGVPQTSSSSSTADLKTTVSTAKTPVTPTTTVSTTKEPSKQKNVCIRLKPCINGRCIAGELENEYICKCQEGYIGKNCDKIKWCIENEGACGGMDCDFDANTNTGFCKCKVKEERFYPIEKKCLPIDECEKMMAKGECRNPHQYCENGDCKCEKNYKPIDKICVANFCGTKPCGENGDCTDLGEGAYECTCHENYILGEDGTCKKLDLCSPALQCEQKCKDGVCECHEGFTLKSDNKTCEMNDGQKECSLDCKNGKCINDKCECPAITHVWNDTHCINRCSAGEMLEDTCPNKECKSNDTYGFICDCKGLYKQAKDGIHCERKNMCLEGGGKSDCEKKNAMCVEQFNDKKGFECKCLSEEYTKNDKDVCIHKCSQAKIVSECTDMLGVCELNASYVPVCKCRPLMVKGDKGICNKLAPYSYTSNLLLPMKLYEKTTSSSLKRVIRSIKHRVDFIRLIGDLEESLKDVSNEIEVINILNCREAGIYLNCSVELQTKSESETKLSIISTKTVCVPTDGGYCFIPPKLVMKKGKIEFKQTDPCNADVTDQICGSSTKCSKVENTKNFQCTCESGFKSIGRYNVTDDGKSTLENCEDIDECQNNKTICPNTTNCVNTPGDYFCTCKDGFRRVDENDTKKFGCIGVCADDPCGEHGTCHQTGEHGFACNCTGSFTGVRCDIPNRDLIDTKNKGHQTASIIGGVLGAALVVMLIVGVVIYRRMKQKAPSDTEEYIGHRKLGILSDMQRRLGRSDKTQQVAEDIEVHTTSGGGGTRRGSGDYRREYRESDLSIPRPHVGEQRGRRPPTEERKSSVMQFRNRGFEED